MHTLVGIGGRACMHTIACIFACMRWGTAFGVSRPAREGREGECVDRMREGKDKCLVRVGYDSVTVSFS